MRPLFLFLPFVRSFHDETHCPFWKVLSNELDGGSLSNLRTDVGCVCKPNSFYGSHWDTLFTPLTTRNSVHLLNSLDYTYQLDFEPNNVGFFIELELTDRSGSFGKTCYAYNRNFDLSNPDQLDFVCKDDEITTRTLNSLRI